MDQVRAFVNVMWTQRFWVLSVVCTLVGVLCWNMAASELGEEFKKRKSAIDGAFTAVNGIKNEPVHPNDDVNKGDMQQAQEQRNLVRTVWQELYDAQRTQVLFWPETIGEQFVKYMQGRKFGDNIASEMRGFYNNYILTRFDALLEIVNAKKMADGAAAGRGGYGRGGGLEGEYGGYGGAVGVGGDEEEEKDYLVEWLDQGDLQRKLLFPNKPTTMQVWVTQEDLWVYETLLQVIKKTNEAKGATRPDNTAVHTIVELQVGREAALGRSTGQILMPQAGASSGRGGEGEYGGYGGGREMGGGEMSAFGGGERGYGGEGGFGREGGMSGMDGGMDDSTLLASRYLGSDGKPDEGGTVDSVISTEFRQLPIRMRLQMDESFIPRILIECANASLPIEVKQLRINPDSSGAGFGAAAIAGRGQAALSTGGAGLTDVIIRGVVYIYNEPDTEKLTIPGEEVAQSDESI